ncbi:1214_t:CDS:2 [Gigaspora rosea]|nr:1214_t:CDS:2 [Gigaspora rosea]
MSESSSSTQASETKKCSDCHLVKKKTSFCRSCGDNPLYEHKTCNSCSKRHGKRNQNVNLQNTTDTDLNVVVPTTSVSTSRTNNASDFLQIHNIIENYDLEPTSENSFFFNNDVANGSRSGYLQNISIIAQENKIEERQENYTYYVKKFEKALELYKREIDNDNFIKNFNTLIRPFVKAVDECEEALQAHKQQGTQKSSNKKLAFWLR